jgi:ribosomal RNA-processing protein 8
LVVASSSKPSQNPEKSTTNKPNTSNTHNKPSQPASSKSPAPASAQASKAINKNGGAKSNLQEKMEKMKKSLAGGRFRMINEKLYTTPSDNAVKLFKDEPETFEIVSNHHHKKTQNIIEASVHSKVY